MKIIHILTITVLFLAIDGYFINSHANDIEAFVEACLSSSNLERPICECSANKADAQLSSKSFAFLVASMNLFDGGGVNPFSNQFFSQL